MSLIDRTKAIKEAKEILSGEEIRVMRTRLKWSQFKLAKESGVSRNKISLYECEYYPLSNDDLGTVAKTLKTALRNI